MPERVGMGLCGIHLSHSSQSEVLGQGTLEFYSLTSGAGEEWAMGLSFLRGNL